MPEEKTEPVVLSRVDNAAMATEANLKAGTGTFGDALLALKAGKKVARKGWLSRTKKARD